MLGSVFTGTPIFLLVYAAGSSVYTMTPCLLPYSVLDGVVCDPGAGEKANSLNMERGSMDGSEPFYRAALRESEERFSAAFAHAPVGIVLTTPDGAFVEANQCFLDILGYSREELASGSPDRFTHPEDVVPTREFVDSLQRDGKTSDVFEKRYVRKDGQIVWARITATLRRDPDGRPAQLIAAVEDVTERRRADEFRTAQTEALILIGEGASLSVVLDWLCRTVESWTRTKARVSILLVDKDGKHLRHGSAPSLPESFNRSIDGAAIGPDIGTCGRAAFFGREIVTDDIANEPFWAPFSELALAHGLRACWSMPILDTAGAVLGTFALYYPEPSVPEARDREVVASISRTAALAIARDKSAAELSAARDQARTILESITDAFYALDANWQFSYVNRAAEIMLQRSRQELTGKSVWEEFPAAVDSEFGRAYHRCRQEGVAVHFEEFYAPLDGWFAVHAYPSPEGLSVYFQNITERKRVQLRDQLFARIGAAIHPLTDAHEITQTCARLLGEHLNVNRCAYADVEQDEDTFNLTGDYNNEVPSIVGRYRFEQFGAECLRLMREGKPYIVEDSESDPRTAEVRESYRMTLIRSVICVSLLKGSRFVAAMAVHQVTPRKWRPEEVELVQQVAERCWESIERARVAREFRLSEERFRTMADNIPNLAWMAHADGHIFWYNRRWYEYTGATPEDMEGWGWQSVHDPEVLPQVIERWKASLGSSQPFEMVFPLRGADAVFRPFLTRVQPVRDASGQVVRWFGTNTDITAQRATEEELRRANRELEEFAYVASHDLQEPLRMVNSYTQLLLRRYSGGDAPEQAQEYANFIRTGVKRMENLISGLLSYAATVKDEHPVASIHLRKSLDQALEVLDTRLQECTAYVQIGELPQVMGDELQMAQVFQNLLSNSLKYRKPDVAPTIRISSERAGKDWVVTVADNGIGFKQEYAERIFGLFRRLHREQYPGTGLGLAICKRIIERHGGRIWVESSPGHGATFRFSLLAAPQDQQNKVLNNIGSVP